MRLALDTNRYRDLDAGDHELRSLLESAEAIYLPFAVLAELRAGFARGTKVHQNEQVLQRFLAKPGVEALFPTHGTTRAYASLYRQLRHQGTPIPTNDLWIAAQVMEHSLALCTRDAHFHHLPQLTLV